MEMEKHQHELDHNMVRQKVLASLRLKESMLFTFKDGFHLYKQQTHFQVRILRDVQRNTVDFANNKVDVFHVPSPGTTVHTLVNNAV